MQKTLFSFFAWPRSIKFLTSSQQERDVQKSAVGGDRLQCDYPLPWGGGPRQAWILLPLSQDGLQKSSGLFRLNLMQYWWRLVRLAQTTLRVDGSMPHQGNRGSLAGREGEVQLSWRLIYLACFSKWTDTVGYNAKPRRTADEQEEETKTASVTKKRLSRPSSRHKSACLRWTTVLQRFNTLVPRCCCCCRCLHRLTIILKKAKQENTGLGGRVL